MADGSLERIELDRNLADKLENASQLEKVKLYQAENIWYEAIANLAQLKCNVATETKAAQKWMDVENINNVPNLSSQFLDNYCQKDLEAQSIVMQ